MHLIMKHTTPNGDTLAIVPGDPDHSGLLWRMSTREPAWQMPPFGTQLVDDAGVQIVRGWISSLPP